MELITPEQERELLRQGTESEANPEAIHPHKPVVKIFGGPATWLISEASPSDPDRLFGLCDLGMGFPELGYVSRSELEQVRIPPYGLPLERDLYFEADRTVTEYAKEARTHRRIVT